MHGIERRKRQVSDQYSFFVLILGEVEQNKILGSEQVGSVEKRSERRTWCVVFQ